jgi:hypothetical protein
MNKDLRDDGANRDPLPAAAGAHPVGTGIGAVVGGLDGRGVAATIDPTRERACWCENFSARDDIETTAGERDAGRDLNWARAKLAARDAWHRISPSS